MCYKPGKDINSTSILQRKHLFANWFSKQKKLTFGNTQEFKIMSKGKGINFHGSKTDKGYDYWNTILQLLPNYSISDIPPHQIILQSWGKDSTISNYQSLKRLKKHKSSNPPPPLSKPKKKQKQNRHIPDICHPSVFRQWKSKRKLKGHTQGLLLTLSIFPKFHPHTIMHFKSHLTNKKALYLPSNFPNTNPHSPLTSQEHQLPSSFPYFPSITCFQEISPLEANLQLHLPRRA